MRFAGDLTFDFRELLTDAAHARDAGCLMWLLIRDRHPEVLVGPGLGSTPLLYATALAALAEGVNLQILMVRDQRKTHHKKRWVEGHRAAARGKRGVLIDDYMRAGSALPLVERALVDDDVGLDLQCVALFFDMWEPLGSRQISVSTLPVVSLFTRHDVGLSRDCFDAAPPLMAGNSPGFIGDAPAWWRFDLNRDPGHAAKCAPVIHGGGVFVADDASTLWRHDLQTGEVDWRVESLAQPAKGIVQLLQAADGSIVYGCYDGTVSRVDALDGRIVWRWRVDSSVHATPWVDLAHGRVYVNTEQCNEGRPTGHLQCLSWDTGRVLWKRRHGWWPPGSAVLSEDAGLVVATCNDGSLGAWQASSGMPLWNAGTTGLVRGRPLVKGSRVVAATEQGLLHSFALETGEPLWTVPYGKGLWHQFLQSTERHVLVMDDKWHFSAFDLETGELAWMTRLRSAGCWAPVRCGRHFVVLSREGHLAVIDPEREVKLWEGRIPGTYEQAPAVGGGMLLAASRADGLLAYRIDPFYEH
jgi:outer membrane protein assembly factor BamB/orotate phosphoribosyltransferase